MDENKKIEKLSETGEQSAEQVSGGAGINPKQPFEKPTPGLLDEPPTNPIDHLIAIHVYGRHCSDCGKMCSSICVFNGKEYCDRCCLKHMKESQKASEIAVTSGESLSESDLLQVSGGINTKEIKDLCKHVDHEYTCRSCGKTFIRRDLTGAGVAMALRPAAETIYCDECLSKIGGFSDKNKKYNLH